MALRRLAPLTRKLGIKGGTPRRFRNGMPRRYNRARPAPDLLSRTLCGAALRVP